MECHVLERSRAPAKTEDKKDHLRLACEQGQSQLLPHSPEQESIPPIQVPQKYPLSAEHPMVEGSSVPHTAEVLDQTLQVYLCRPLHSIVKYCYLANNARFSFEAMDPIVQRDERQALISSLSLGDQVSFPTLQLDIANQTTPVDTIVVSKSWTAHLEGEDDDKLQMVNNGRKNWSPDLGRRKPGYWANTSSSLLCVFSIGIVEGWATLENERSYLICARVTVQIFFSLQNPKCCFLRHHSIVF